MQKSKIKNFIPHLLTIDKRYYQELVINPQQRTKGAGQKM